MQFQASMQEYRLRLLLLDRLQPTSSPPPTYRSNAGSIVTPGTTRESRPPSYCARSNIASNTNVTPSKKDANLVRIVQTESEPVILSGDQTPPVAAVEVLAHLWFIPTVFFCNYRYLSLRRCRKDVVAIRSKKKAPHRTISREGNHVCRVCNTIVRLFHK